MPGPVLAREVQYNFLHNALQKCMTLPGAILVWGPNSSGKSTVVEKSIQDSRIKHVACVSGREIVCGLRQFLVTIVKQLFQGFENLDLRSINCETTLDFVNKLTELKSIANVRSEKVVLIIEDAETLRSEHGDLIEIFSRLQDLVQFNICVILISILPFTSYCFLLDLKPMVTINFPQYTKDEIVSILLRQAPSGANVDLYSFHVKMTVSVFYIACRDMRKLQRLTLLNFENFVKPFRETSSKFSQKKMHELWMTIQPKLSQDFKTLKANILPANDCESAEKGKAAVVKCRNFHRLPVSLKYLLVSAYLATYNPPSSDKRFFVKSFLGKKRRRAHEDHESEKSQDPQMFPLSRLLAIFDFLTDHSLMHNQLLLSQVTHLCKLELLERAATSALPLDEPKFKCVASFEFVEDVAESIDLDIKKYLFQFL